MNKDEYKIDGNTTIIEAIQILKNKVDAIAHSEEAAKFFEENPSWSSLFRENYTPHQIALKEYQEALELNEWLNGKNPENGALTIKEAFMRMTDQQRLTLFSNRINSKIPGIFDYYLQVWWINRY